MSLADSARSNRKLLEICVDSWASAERALVGGADRVELCSALSLGGLTPSAGLLAACCELAAERTMVMIRPRAGDFCYSAQEIRIMCRDIETVQQLGARGVVLGTLDQQARIDTRALQQLLSAARPLDVTFHRAFDLAADLPSSLEQLCELGMGRVLTSGGAFTAWDGREQLADLVRQAAGRMLVMAGAGIRPDNVAALARETLCHELHASARAEPAQRAFRGSPNRLELARTLAAENTMLCSERLVRQLRSALDQLSQPQELQP